MKGTSDFLVFKQTGLFGRFFYLCNRIVTASGYGRGFLACKNAPQAVACGASGKVTFHGLKWAAQAELCAPWVGSITFTDNRVGIFDLLGQSAVKRSSVTFTDNRVGIP